MTLRQGVRSLAAGAVTCAAVLSLALPAAANVHAGDQLDVTVFNHPDLSRKVTVDSAGRIAYPLIGTLNVSDADASMIARRMTAALSYYVNDAHVEVEVVGEGQFINVAGGPGGKIAYTPGETLMTAIATLKTVDTLPIEHSRVDLARVDVERDGRSLGTFDVNALSANGGSGPTLQPGDTLAMVDKPNQVRVAGAVVHPGIAYLGTDEPLSEAIVQVGGALPTAADGNLTLTRDGVARRVSDADPVFFAPARNGDQISVPPAPRVTVAGSVMTPSTVALKANDTLVGAVYSAGGPAKDADLRHVTLVRPDGTRSTYDFGKIAQGDTKSNVQLTDGDMVFVPQGHTMQSSTLWSVVGAIAGLGSLIR